MSIKPSVQQLQRIFDSLQEGYFSVDRDGLVTMVSPSTGALMACKSDVLIGRELARCFDDSTDYACLLQRLNEGGGRLSHFEVQLRRDNGERFWASINVHCIYDEQNRIAGLEGTLWDITPRKRIEQELQEIRERHRQAQRLARLGHWQLDIVQNKLIWSDEVYRIFEIDRSRFGATYEAFLNTIHPDDRDLVNQAYSDSLLSRIGYDIEHRLLMKDGRIKWVHERCETDYDVDGAPLRSIGTVHDITDRKSVALELEAERRRFRTLFEASADGMFILDMQGRFIDINRTAHERLGYSKTELMAMSIRELDPPEYAVRVPERMRMIFDHGNATFETAHYRRDGSIMQVEVNARIINLDDRQVIFSVIRDISERKRLEEQLRQSQKMEAIGTLVGGIAHDFNNMLAAIQGNLFLARRQIPEHVAAAEKLANIEKLGNRAADMVQQLLTFARKGSVVMRVFTLNHFMKEAYKLARAAIPENIDHFTIICPEELCIRGDATQLQQVLMNLLNNAVDAVAERAHPKIRCTLSEVAADESFFLRHPGMAAGNYACITVADNGEGISHSHLDKIFEPYFTTKEVGKGSGLGLAMLYGAVQGHGGVVEVESDVGVGTIFRILLPVCDACEEEPTLPPVHPELGQGETVLLVDDDSYLRQVTAEVLESFGYRLLMAGDGQEALALLEAQPVDLVLSDVVMPVLGGNELLAVVRRVDAHLPVILVTGYDRYRLLGGAMDDPACQTLNKPFEFDALSAMIRQMLSNKRVD